MPSGVLSEHVADVRFVRCVPERPYRASVAEVEREQLAGPVGVVDHGEDASSALLPMVRFVAAGSVVPLARED